MARSVLCSSGGPKYMHQSFKTAHTRTTEYVKTSSDILRRWNTGAIYREITKHFRTSPIFFGHHHFFLGFTDVDNVINDNTSHRL